jgi:hypothetical protein
MKRTVCMAAAFICATTLGAAAQRPATTTAGSTTDKGDKITVSGCLQGGSRSSTTTASGSSTDMGNYVLVTSPMGSSDTTAGTTGTTGTTTAASDTRDANSRDRAGASYTLDGRDSELKNHVGHRIEVTGTVENHDGHEGSPATSTTTSGSASSRMSTSNQTLKVSSIRMISSSCSAK